MEPQNEVIETIEYKGKKIELMKGLPKNFWPQMKERFPWADEKDTFLSFGNKIYIPGWWEDHMLAHELTHCERQGFTEEGAIEWYKKYINDDEFLVAEELLAYREQYSWFKYECLDKNKRLKFAELLAIEFSGPRYGKIITYSNAFLSIIEK